MRIKYIILLLNNNKTKMTWMDCREYNVHCTQSNVHRTQSNIVHILHAHDPNTMYSLRALDECS